MAHGEVLRGCREQYRMANFHRKPFDEGTLVKLRLFENYLRDGYRYSSRKLSKVTESTSLTSLPGLVGMPTTYLGGFAIGAFLGGIGGAIVGEGFVDLVVGW